MDALDQVRRFNRVYTQRMGLLAPHLPGGEVSLPEGRVIYELAQAGQGRTAADLSRSLSLDKGYLSRLLKRLAQGGLVQSRRSPHHARHHLLTLTAAGAEAFAALEQGARRQVADLLGEVEPARRSSLLSSMSAIEAALGEAPPPAVTLRFPQVGDLGWITHRQARLYAEEHGWDWTYEALVASILGPFVRDFDPARDDAWIAVRGGEIVGSIFLMRGDAPGVARLRLLYVEPSARGLAVGRQLVTACIERARALGYRRLTLWTNSVLAAARSLYVRAGFTLNAEEPHHSFGHDLMGQTWDLDLTKP